MSVATGVRLRLSASAFVLTLAAASRATAQSPAPPPTPGSDAAPAESPKSTVTEVIVTAQRREQRLQDAPVAVTALGPQALEQLNIQTTQDLMQAVPGLVVTTQSAADGGGSATFFVRGMGQQLSGNGTQPAVGIYVDDFYYPSLYGSIFDIVDLAQVEVLRGPQGTLFGRNTIGGAIRYTTLGPKLNDFSGHVAATGGSLDRADFAGSVNLPIGDVAALRLTAGHLQRDGYVHVQSTGGSAGATRTDLVRLQVLFKPTSSLRFELSGQYSEFNLDGYTYNVPGPLTPRPPGPGQSPTLPFIYNSAVAPALGLPQYTDAYRSNCFYCQYGTSVPEYSRTSYKNVLSTITWDFAPGLSLKSLTGWQEVRNKFQFDLDSTPLPVFGGYIDHNYTQSISQEFQLNGKLLDNRLNFVTGLFYYDERYNTAQDTPIIILASPLPRVEEQRNLDSYAAYLDGAFKLSDKLSLLGGYRFSQDNRNVDARDPAGPDLATGKATFSSSTYRAGLQYQWTRDAMTYANVSSGFRGGGFNPYAAGRTPALQPFGPENATSYEVGARLQMLDRRLTINPTAFYVDWSKIQVAAVRTDPVSGNVDTAIQNAGAARSYGVELEFSADVTRSLKLFGNLAYLNLRYTDIGNASGITKDSDFEHAPPVTFELGASYTLDLDSLGKVLTTLNYSRQDDQTSTPTDAQALHLRAYGVLNGRVEFTPPNKRYVLSVFVTNLLAENYAIGGVNYYADIGSARYDLGRPREVGVSARFNF